MTEDANVLLCAPNERLMDETCRELRRIAADEKQVLGQVADVSKNGSCRGTDFACREELRAD